MRRTFQDLARQAQVKDIVTRAISGHATEQMQRRYSTVAAREVEESIGKVSSLARARELLETAAKDKKEKEGPGGADGGDRRSPESTCDFHRMRKSFLFQNVTWRFESTGYRC